MRTRLVYFSIVYVSEPIQSNGVASPDDPWWQEYLDVATTLGLLLPRPRGTRAHVVAVVGAGGKSTTVFALASILHSHGQRVAVTTTTKMGIDQTGGLTTVPPDIAEVRLALETYARCRIASQPNVESPKVIGPPEHWIDELADSGIVDAIVIEADGARRKNVKAPAHYEPVLPDSCTHVVSVLGANALDRVIEDQGHRPLRIAAALGCSPYDRLTSERAAMLLCSELGGRKDVNDREWCALITQVDDANRMLAVEVRRLVRARGLNAALTSFDPSTRDLVRTTDNPVPHEP